MQLCGLKRQGVTNQDIASRMGRSVKSVQGRWSQIADEGEKRKQVPFSKAEDKLVRLTCLTSIYLVTTHCVSPAAAPGCEASALDVAPDRAPLSWPQREYTPATPL